MSKPPKNDPKINRITASWFRANDEAAAWLASVADEVVAADSHVLRSGRFSYVALDHSHDGVVVAPGTSPFAAVCPTSVLVVPTDRIDEAARLIPAIASAWANRLDSTVDVAVHRQATLTA